MNHRLIQIFHISFLGILFCGHVASSQIHRHLAQEFSNHTLSYPIHGSDLLWKQERSVRKYIAEHPDAMKSSTLRKTSWSFVKGSTWSWYADNFTNNNRYLVASTCRAVGINCYIFVEDSSWIEGRVGSTVVDSIRLYFDSKTPADTSKGIFEMDTAAFGNPPNVDSDPKIIILLLDIKDGYTGSGGYVEGYFNPFNEVNPSQPGYSTSNFAEMFFIDTNPLDLRTEAGLYGGISTLAHEFQHMIHFNYDNINNKQSGDLTFVDEGCSLIAEVNCGFPIYDQSFYVNETNHYLFDWHYYDMTAVLADYSRAARFFVYLRDQTGIGIFKNIVASPLYGKDAINAGLQAYGSTWRFNDILQNWFIANILDDRSIDPKYGYLYPNLPKASGYIQYNPNVTLRTDTVQNYAAEYVSFKNGSQLKATFTKGSDSLSIKAVEIGPSYKQVRDVTSGVEFSEPQYGTAYTEIHFVVMNTDSSTPLAYSYQASGVSKALELKYDSTEPTGYLRNSAGDTVCVWFDAVAGGRLDSVRVALRRAGTMTGGIWTYSGSLRSSPLGAPLAVPIVASISTTPGVPYPVPWPNWATIDLTSKLISTSNPFAVAFVCAGDPTKQPRVMVTESPTPTLPTSLTYFSQDTLPDWYYITIPNGADDSVYTYLIRAYVSFDTTSIKPDTTLLPTRFTLSQNYPNPFNPGTTIEFTLPKDSKVSLNIYDMLGRKVATLVNKDMKASVTPYEVKFDASALASGVYFYRIVAGSFTETRKLVVLK